MAERLTTTMPPGLDTCVFVNSGSEANDPAWQLATQSSGHRWAIVTDWAYDGVSAATAALSSNTWPAGYRPDHVAVIGAPYPEAAGSVPTAAAARALPSRCLASADWR